MPNTTRGYPYPTIADPPAVAQHIESLAEAVDNDLSTNYGPTTYIRLARSTQFTVPGDNAWHLIGSWPDGTQKKVGNINYAGAGLVQILQAGEYEWQFAVNWPALDSSNLGFRRFGTVFLGRGGATPSELVSAGGFPVGSGKDSTIVPAGAWGTMENTYSGIIPCQVNDVLQAALLQSNFPQVLATPYVFIVRRVA